MSELRYELKFILNHAEFVRAQNWLQINSSARKTYPARYVNSIYLDDAAFSSARDNLSGISDRRKIRLRWYHSEGSYEKISSTTLEAKYRHGRLGYKKRFPVNDLGKNLLNLEHRNLYKELRYHVFNKENYLNDTFLHPTLQVSYLREYYEGINNIRITFDKNIQFYNPLPHSKPFNKPSVSYPNIIMEIKFSPNQKNLIASTLHKSNLTPKRHSKYLVGLAALGLAVYI